MKNPAQLPTLPHPIPGNPTCEPTALDILGIESREISISKAYTYFLSQKLNFTITRNLLDTLLELICKELEKVNNAANQATISLLESFNLTSATTEASARKRKRIDILLRDDEHKVCIAIENKIYAGLYNHLEDYLYPTDFKDYTTILVVLSLFPVALNNFSIKLNSAPVVGILHRQWMENIEPQANEEPLSAHFNDFHRHLLQLSRHMTFDDTTAYYFQHSKVINAVIAAKKTAEDFLKFQLQMVAEGQGLILEWKTAGYSYLKRKSSDTIFITIIQQDLLQEQVLTLILEKRGEIAHEKENNLKDIVQQVESRSLEDEDFFWQKISKDKKAHYEHLLILKSKPLALEQIKEIHSIIGKLISKHFISLMDIS